MTATGGALDATLKGPIDDLGGEGTLTIGSVEVGGREAGDVSADLTLARASSAYARVRPKSTRPLDVSIGLEGTEYLRGPGYGRRLRHPCSLAR